MRVLRVSPARWIDRLGDAEVQQLDLPPRGDQHVARLEVAVQQQVAVRVGHRLGQLQEQRQALLHRQAHAGLVDRSPGHVFHDEVGQAVGRAAGIEQVGDVRMVQPRERLLLEREARQHRVGVHAALEHLDGGLAAEGAVGALGQPHLAHAPAADGRGDAPRAAALADAAVRQVRRIGQPRPRQEVIPVPGRMGQQREHLGSHRRLVRRVGEQRLALAFLEREGGVEQGAHFVPIGGGRRGLAHAPMLGPAAQ